MFSHSKVKLLFKRKFQCLGYHNLTLPIRFFLKNCTNWLIERWLPEKTFSLLTTLGLKWIIKFGFKNKEIDMKIAPSSSFSSLAFF